MPVDFFKLTSQIIPLLFIGLAIQSTVVSRKIRYKKGESRSWLLHIDNFLMLTYIMMFAEYYSLRDVWYGKWGKLDPAVIAVALVAPAIIFIYEYSFGLLGAERIAWEKLRPLFLLITILFTVLILSNSWTL